MEALLNAVDTEQILKAVAVLRKVKDEKNKNLQSLLEDDKIMLLYNLNKIPKVGKNYKVVNICLPVSAYDGDACLFVGDAGLRNRASIQETINYYESLLSKCNLPEIKEVIPLLKIKLEYSSFESRRVLLSRFDRFLADDRIMRLLPSRLGKCFFSTKSKGKPRQVKINNEQKLEKELKKALHTVTSIVSGKGSCSNVVVGDLRLSDDDISLNIKAALKQLCAKVPGGVDNLGKIYIRTVHSPALPLYAPEVDRSSVQTPSLKENKPEEDELMEEVSTIKGKVSVSRDGTITILHEDGSVKQVIGGLSDSEKRQSTYQKVEQVAAYQKETKESQKREAKKLKRQSDSLEGVTENTGKQEGERGDFTESSEAKKSKPETKKQNETSEKGSANTEEPPKASQKKKTPKGKSPSKSKTQKPAQATGTPIIVLNK